MRQVSNYLAGRTVTGRSWIEQEGRSDFLRSRTDKHSSDRRCHRSIELQHKRLARTSSSQAPALCPSLIMHSIPILLPCTLDSLVLYWHRECLSTHCPALDQSSLLSLSSRHLLFDDAQFHYLPKQPGPNGEHRALP